MSDLAKYFAQNSNVFAYEVFNEPFPGNIYFDFELFQNSTYGDLTLLQPLYDRVSQAIRKYDRQGFLAFEPLVSNGEVLARKAGFSHPPGGYQYSNVDILAFHTYCDVTESYAYDCELAGSEYAVDCNDIISGDPNYCRILFQADFAQRTADAIQLDVPILVTEFGSFTGNETLDVLTNQYIVNLADVNFTSWTNWDWLYLQQFPYIMPAIVRTYAQAIAGTPVSQNFAPTEIFVPTEIHYPNGYSIQTSPSGMVRWHRRGQNRVELYPTFFVRPGQLVTVTITPN